MLAEDRHQRPSLEAFIEVARPSPLIPAGPRNKKKRLSSKSTLQLERLEAPQAGPSRPPQASSSRLPLSPASTGQRLSEAASMYHDQRVPHAVQEATASSSSSSPNHQSDKENDVKKDLKRKRLEEDDLEPQLSAPAIRSSPPASVRLPFAPLTNVLTSPPPAKKAKKGRKAKKGKKVAATTPKQLGPRRPRNKPVVPPFTMRLRSHGPVLD